MRSWDERHLAAESFFVPWTGAAVALDGCRVVDFGGGSGSMALALAPHVRSVLCLDESEPAVRECAERASQLGLGNVEAEHGSFDQLLERLGPLEGSVDIFVLFAVLEHMSVGERLATLEAAASCLTPDGVIVVGETPNRLLWNDHHTTQTPFFGLLPDDLALELAPTIRRTEIATRLTDEALSEPQRRLELTRFGRGVSYHEFEAVFGTDVHDHVIASGWDPMLRQERAEHRDEFYLARFLASHEPHVSPCFSRYWIDLILRPGETVEHPTPRPWALHTLGSESVSITPWETARVAVDGTLLVDLPAPAARIAIGIIVGPDDASEGPVLELNHGDSRTTVVFDAHRADEWIQQAVVDLPESSDRLGISFRPHEVDVTSVLWWPEHPAHTVPPLRTPLVGPR